MRDGISAHFRIVTGEGNPEGHLCLGGGPLLQWEPNARLIAAAPDMAEALALVVNCADSDETNVGTFWRAFTSALSETGALKKARAALEKAGL